VGTDPPRRRVAIVGAGVAGLTAAKALLEEGLSPVVFERAARVGGLWNYDEALPDGGGLAYRSLRTNTAKLLTAFSDFPFPDTAPDYPHRSEVADYLQQYAARFGLLEHIQFLTQVETVEPAEGGRWRVRTRPVGGGAAAEIVFDAVVCASGLFGPPAMPAPAGADTFEGRVLHSAAYKGPESFAGERVLVVGVGSSGADLAVEVSGTAQQVMLSTVRGAWTVPRYAGKQPFGHLATRLAARLPARMQRQLLRQRLLALYRERGLDHTHLALEPFDPPRTRMTPGTDLLAAIQAGKISVHPGIGRLEAHEAVFTDGARQPVDAILYCTGYQLSLPYLEPGLVEVSDNRPLLFKHVFAPDHPGLAFIGYFQTTGPIPPLAEMQARWVARVFVGRATLPPPEMQRADIAAQFAAWRASGAPTLRLPWLAYMDELAGFIGVRPKLWTRPWLLAKMMLGPVEPKQYRGKW
jgi:dimethylaniline monooxygenase (N-oxide forming) / hypotaurine monooxygenase